jgi:hypothetical protein
MQPFLLLTWLVLVPVATASVPKLVVHRADGPAAVHALDDIECLEFAADSLRVRLTGGPVSYALTVVERLTYRWEPTAVIDQDAAEALTRTVHLLPSRPNPWAPDTRIAFDLPRPGPVRLRIYGVDGRLIRSLANESFTAGQHSVPWDGRDDAGLPAASGVYVYRLEADRIDESRKLLLVR